MRTSRWYPGLDVRRAAFFITGEFRDVLALVSGRQSEPLESGKIRSEERQLEYVTVLMVHAQLQSHCQSDFRAK